MLSDTGVNGQFQLIAERKIGLNSREGERRKAKKKSSEHNGQQGLANEEGYKIYS